MIHKKKNKPQKKDWCGPENSPLLSALIPDSIFGISIADCCKQHDEDFQEDGTEKDFKRVNKQFHKCLKCRFVEKVGRLRYYTRGFFAVAYCYYKAVKEQGSKHFNYA